MLKLPRRKTALLATVAICALAVTYCLVAFIGQSDRMTVSNQPTTNFANQELTHFFTEADKCGISFVHQTAPPGTYFFPEIVGSGVALLDFDRDGDLDIYCVNLGDEYGREGNAERPSLSVANRFYEQVEVGKFVDRTRETGLGDTGIGMGAAVGDVNNDGYCDVYVSNYGQDRLFLNQAGKSFLDVTKAAGIDNPRWGTSACFFDYDRDGWLDLYVCNYVEYHRRACTQLAGGGEDYCAPRQFPAAADKLFHNITGQYINKEASDSKTCVRFEDVSVSSGVAARRGPGLGVTCADFNGDHWPDIYVANDQTSNFLWLNQQDGKFLENAVLLGCATDAAGAAQASMGIASGDLNNDARLDLFLTHLQGEHHTLYLSEGSPFFRDRSIEAGFDTVNPFTGFGTALLDIDHDGDLDLSVVNGAVRRPSARKTAAMSKVRYEATLPEFWKTYAEPNQIFLNDGTGKFQKRVDSAFSAHADVSRGLAMGDLDNDGDVDLAVSNTAGRMKVFLNQSVKKGNWVKIRVLDRDLGGRADYGASVTCRAQDRSWTSVVQPASYLSSHDSCIHFGLGNAAQIDRFEVVWSDGTRQEFSGGTVNREYQLGRVR